MMTEGGLEDVEEEALAGMEENELSGLERARGGDDEAPGLT